jgi:hypothetical protein
MEKFMVEEKHIRDVMKSRDNLTACWVNGVSCQLSKAAKQGNIEFAKHIIKTSIRCGRAMTSWKEVRTILQPKQGDGEVIGNWRPISITDCADCVFTCSLAQTFRDPNARYG